MSSHRTTFRLRRFSTNLVLVSFVVSAVSGVVLFLRPEGSLARWIGWTVIGLDKKHWESVHLTFVAVFLLACLAHVWFNWASLVASVRRRSAAVGSTAGILLPSRESAAALVLAAVVFSGTVVEWRPFSSLVALRTSMKDGVLVTLTPPPESDADRLTLAEACERAAITEQEAVRNARARGIEIRDASVSLADLAREHRVSPEAVYRAIRGDDPPRAVSPQAVIPRP